MSQDTELAQRLCAFISQSPTPFHAVREMARQLEVAGYQRLDDSADWSLHSGGRYYLTRNESSLIAFQLGTDLRGSGLRMVGAHTDSPCLKVKPAPELRRHGCLQLGVEVYGGVLLNPWFDRDLSMAGRVSYQDSEGRLASTLIDFRDPVAVIPSLAIHLDREVNKSRSINNQKDLPPLVMQLAENEKTDFRGLLHKRLLEEHPGLDVDAVLDYEICLYDTQAPALVGLQQDFVAGARLDNLLSCFVGLQSLLSGADSDVAECGKLLVCTDHEEVGSASAAGASGPFLESVLQRLAEGLLNGSASAYQRMLSASKLISVDNAHAIHPNFPDRHDNNHGPLMNAGPVIKYNANQRYASNSNTAALFRRLCAAVDVPCQSFVVRSDMACGSTIGPLMATELGIDTVDVGVPTLGMHSIRELGGSRDLDYMQKVLGHYFAGGC